MAVTLLDPKSEFADDVALWRYMKVSTFFLLLEGKVFFPSVATLQRNDPIEGGLRPDPPSLLNGISSGDYGADAEFHKWLLEQEGASLDPTRNNFAAWQNSDRIAEIYLRQLAKRRAAWCWFRSYLESAAMWHVYGSNGLAIRTSLGALKDSLPDSKPFQIAAIRYVDRRSSSAASFHPRSPHDQPLIRRPHLLKAMEYEHEKEVRVTTTCYPKRSGEMIRGIQYAKLVKEVVFSPLMPREEVKSLQKMIAAYSWHDAPSTRRSSLVAVTPDPDDFLDETLEEKFERYGFIDEETNLPLLMREL